MDLDMEVLSGRWPSHLITGISLITKLGSEGKSIDLLPFISAIQREIPGASLPFPRDLPVDQNLLPCAFTHNQCSEFPLDRFLLSPHLHAFRLMIDLPPMLGHVPKIFFPFSREGKFDLSSSLGPMSVCHS